MATSKHAWMEDVLRDIVDYAAKNGLHKSKEVLEWALLSVSDEIGYDSEQASSVRPNSNPLTSAIKPH